MASLPNHTTVTCEEWLHLPEVKDAIEDDRHAEVHNSVCGLIVRKAPLTSAGGNIHSAPQLPVEVLARAKGHAILAEGLLKPALFPGVQVDIVQTWPD